MTHRARSEDERTKTCSSRGHNLPGTDRRSTGKPGSGRDAARSCAGCQSGAPTGTLADYTCGHITQTSWGAGQVCYLIDSHHGQTIWKFAVLDKITDGYCVDGRRLTPDKSMYTITSPRVRSCTTGGWSTGFLATVNLEFGVRVFRSNSTDGGISFKVDMPPPY